MSNPALYIVSTPIGNLDDITARAVGILQEADIIAAEDTRQIAKLLSHLQIKKKELISYHEHVEKTRAVALIDRMSAQGLRVALVSDAGTPCISDPGYRLVAAAKERGIPVHPVPGPSALTALVAASGLPSDRFTFIGFMPHKISAIKKEIASWALLHGAIVFYESTRRLRRTLESIAETHPTAQVAIGREMTKLYEEIVNLSIDQAVQWATHHENMRGEAAVMVCPNLPASEIVEIVQGDEQSLAVAAAALFREGVSLKELLFRFNDCGFSRSDLYRILLRAKSRASEESES